MTKNKIFLAVIVITIVTFVAANVFAGSGPGFGTVTVAPAFELDGRGKNVDSIAFWETPDPAETLIFVTAKNNNLLEVWKYPFLGNELSPIEFSSSVNGVAVDQEMDLLYVTESGAKKVAVFSLPDLQLQGEFGQGDLGKGETNLDILKHANSQTLIYVTDDHTVHWFDAVSGIHLGKFSPPVSSIETVLADDFYQVIMVPEEQGPKGNPGIYAFHPDGTPFEKNGTNRFGNNGEFDSDEEGILLYTLPTSGIGDDGTGFIVVSDQRKSQTDFEIFDRQTWEHLGTLRIDGVSNTDGIASTQKPLPDYPMGLFVAINDDKTVVGVGWDVIFEKTGLPGLGDNSTSSATTQFRLRQNYPNPFNPTTTIQFELAKHSSVKLNIYDLLGKKVATLIDAELQPGEYKINFDDEGISSGVYFYRIHAEELSQSPGQVFFETKKLLLLK